MTREEAIKKVRQMSLPKETMEILEALAPELKESEDERIRKGLVKLLTVASEAYLVESTGIKKDSYLAYLEKQKEQIPYTDFVIKPHKGDDNNPYDMRVSEAQEYAIKRGFGIPFNDGEVYVDERHMTQTIGNIIRWADEHPKEQKPEWSEEDTEMYINIASSLRGYACGLENEEHKKHIKKGLDWLANRFNFKPLRPQSHWKPSEVCYGPKGDPDPAGVWKPSEEQLKALLNAEGFLRAGLQHDSAKTIAELYEQLKKL